MNNTTKDPLLDDYRYSIGNTPMVDTLLKIFEHPKCKVDTVTFNISTLLRNTYDPDLRMEEWVTATYSEIRDIVSELKQVMEASVTNPKILLYYVDYSGLIPDALKRPLNVSRLKMEKGMKGLVPLLNKAGYGKPGESSDTINLKYGPKRANPADLSRMIKRFDNKRNTCLISHIPLDYHIHRYIKNLKLVYSYTGQVVTPDKFGIKIFGNEEVPFNRHTHAVLGDKVTFRSTLKPKLKRELLNIATKDKWRLQPESGILRSMKNHQYIPPFTICI